MKFIYSITFSLFLVSCGPNDNKILADVNNGLALTGGKVTAAVEKGVVTLSGECPDQACITNSEAAVKSIKGVKQVVNTISIASPPAPAVIISADDSLSRALNSFIGKYNTVKVAVSEGVVTLTGEIKRADLKELMQEVSATKPKRIENKLQIK